MDRTFIASDSVLNFKKNHLASKALKVDMLQSQKSLSPDARSALYTKYKQAAHNNARFMRPIDFNVSKIRSDFSEVKNRQNWKDRAPKISNLKKEKNGGRW
jgi:hypothetical protein